VFKISTTLTISLSLACLAVSVLFTAQVLGLVPNETELTVEHRTQFSQLIAIQCSTAVGRSDRDALDEVLKSAVFYGKGLSAARILRADKREVAVAGDMTLGAERLDQVVIPITRSERDWGTVELGYEPISGTGFWAWFMTDSIRLSAFLFSVCVIGFSWYLHRILKHLDPSKAVPNRVRTTLDTITEGLVVLDDRLQIVLCNSAFAEHVSVPADGLQGKSLDGFASTDMDDMSAVSPWDQCVTQQETIAGRILRLEKKDGQIATFKVTASPILDDAKDLQGALLSFDDITEMEERNQSLTEMLAKLKSSRDQIRRQNQELQLLATRDPLTSALNRRSFFEMFESHWTSSHRYGQPLSCVMVDIDFFKSINDNHGHSMGDLVLQKVSQVLQTSVRDTDLVCRYGGEEFCLLMPHQCLDTAAKAAERIRQEIAAFDFSGLRCTTSVGVSSLELNPENMQDLIDQADKCLFVAKRNGRNQVVRWDEVPHDLEVDESQISRTQDEEESVCDRPAISFQTVSALVSALGSRDAASAEHCRRVADLCVRTAKGLMSISDSFILENSALLHDIGKIGVPDSVLLKPGPLTEEERKVILSHEQIGVEIVRSTFACDEMTDIVLCHRARYGADERPDLPSGKDIPLGARILCICEAYDAMVNDQVYRTAMSTQEAFAELRRCAGEQFDPDLVERFINTIQMDTADRSNEIQDVSMDTALQLGLQIE